MDYNYIFGLLMGLAILGNSCSVEGKGNGSFKMQSSAFENGGKIPSKYSYGSYNMSPSLTWENQPLETKSFALIMDDPDAPSKVWVHWVIFNIPANSTGLPENMPKKSVLPDGTIQGISDFGNNGYDGPYPPPGKPHRYYFKLYALDTKLPLDSSAKKEDVEKAMKGHILAEINIMGTYKR